MQLLIAKLLGIIAPCEVDLHCTLQMCVEFEVHIQHSLFLLRARFRNGRWYSLLAFRPSIDTTLPPQRACIHRGVGMAASDRSASMALRVAVA